MTVRFVLDNGEEHQIEGDSDETLYDLVVNSELDIDGFGKIIIIDQFLLTVVLTKTY